MGEFIVHLEFAKILGIAAVIAIIFTLIMYLVFRNNRVVKYIPGLIFIVIGLYNLFYLGKESSTVEGVNRVLIIVVAMVAGFIGLSTGLIIGIFKKGRE